MLKNTASQKLRVFAFDATTNLPKTGDAANITAYVSKDYGAVTVLGDTSATEESSSNAAGCYLFDLTQAETNADYLGFSAKSSTANIVVIPVPMVVFTDPAGYTGTVAQTGDSFARLGAPAGASVTADIAAVNAKTTNLPASPAATGDAMTLTAGERNSIATAHLDLANGVETGITVRQGHRLNVAASAGKLSGAATTTIKIRDTGDTKDRINATVDSSGNRTAVTLDVS